MEKFTIGFIGAGNMAQAIVAGLIKECCEPADIWMSAPSKERCDHVCAVYGVNSSVDNRDVVENSDILILATKPQVLPEVIDELSGVIRTKGCLVVSVAAGASLRGLRKYLGDGVSIVRAMPNTPALVGKGITGLLPDQAVSQTQVQQVEKIFKSLGPVVWVDTDEAMDAVTAVSGSGPAYFFYVWEQMIEEAEASGLSQERAQQLVLETSKGALTLFEKSDDALSQLRINVTSPNGTTEAGLKEFEQCGVGDGIRSGIHAAKRRAAELAAEFESSV